jgi:tetratricopeptide (TPR) repeat protein
MMSGATVGSTASPPRLANDADVRPYIVKTYDRWIILAIVLIGGWFLFRPLFAFAVYYRGVSFEHMLTFKPAEHYYRKAIGVDPRVPEGWQGLGELWLWTLGPVSLPSSYRDATQIFRTGLTYNPKSGALAFDLCRATYEIGKDYAQARDACELATRNWPSNAFTWDYAGWANLRLGNKEKAVAFWREAVKHGHLGAQRYIEQVSGGP